MKHHRCVGFMLGLWLFACGQPRQDEPAGNGCPENSLRITSGECAPRCVANSDCATNCCVPLTNASTGEVAFACRPSTQCPPDGAGGGSGSLRCEVPTTSGSCPESGQLFCGGNRCCPTSHPYHSGSNCHQSPQSVANNGGTSCTQCVTPSSGAGGGSGGSGGGTGTSCPPSRNGCFTCTNVQRDTCGNPRGVVADCVNNCAERVVYHICLERSEGGFTCLGGSLGAGERTGTSLSSGLWICEGTGNGCRWSETDTGGFIRCSGTSC